MNDLAAPVRKVGVGRCPWPAGSSADLAVVSTIPAETMVLLGALPECQSVRLVSEASALPICTPREPYRRSSKAPLSTMGAGDNRGGGNLLF